MYGKYRYFANPLKTGDIMHMCKQCVPGLSLGGGGVNGWSYYNIKSCEGTGKSVVVHPASVLIITKLGQKLLTDCGWSMFSALCFCKHLGNHLGTVSS